MLAISKEVLYSLRLSHNIVVDDVAGVNCTTDLIVTFLPIIILGKLKMKLRIKIALGVLMTMSILSVGVPIH